jgi:hypothetical protein
MILDSKEKTAWSYRSLRDCPHPAEANVDITLFANYYGTVKGTHSFNDPALYTDKSWWTRLMNEISEMKVFRRKYKHAKNS